LRHLLVYHIVYATTYISTNQANYHHLQKEKSIIDGL